MKILRKIPRLYYYVPPCPECGSRRTGHYLRLPITPADARYVEEESLMHGELIRFARKVPDKNAYCEDCGYEWPCEVHAQLMPAEKVEEEIEARGTSQRYARFVEENPKKKKTVFGKIFSFLP